MEWLEIYNSLGSEPTYTAFKDICLIREIPLLSETNYNQRIKFIKEAMSAYPNETLKDAYLLLSGGKGDLIFGEFIPTTDEDGNDIQIKKSCCADKPPIITQIKSLGKSAIEIAKSGFKQVNEQEYLHRLEICSICEEFLIDQKRCIQCGCYMNIKAGYEVMSCEKGKW